jgi:hypothetical protein
LVADHLLEKLGYTKSQEELINYGLRYESNVILSLFLMHATDFPRVFPDSSTQSLSWYGNLLKALLWEAECSKRKVIFDVIIGWVNNHLKFDEVEPKLRKNQVCWIWNVPEGPLLLFKEINEMNYSELMRILGNKIFNLKNTTRIFSALNIKPPLREDDEFTEFTDEAFLHPASVSGLTNSIIKSSSNSNYRNITDLLEDKSVGIIIPSNFIPENFNGHEWSKYQSRHKNLLQEHSPYSWEGSMCLKCGCFLIRRKISNRYSNIFVLGLDQCPEQPPAHWLAEYQPRIEAALHAGKLGQMERHELESWGFLGDLPIVPPSAPVAPISSSHHSSSNALVTAEILGDTSTWEDHEWIGNITSRHTNLFQKAAAYCWLGDSCKNCGCFRVSRKISNRQSKLHVLGFEKCPGTRPVNWLPAYKPQLIQLFKSHSLGQMEGKDLIDWQYLEEGDLH